VRSEGREKGNEHIVVDGGEGVIETADLAAGLSETLESLRGGNLVDDVTEGRNRREAGQYAKCGPAREGYKVVRPTQSVQQQV
jgi:hypothetical protein